MNIRKAASNIKTQHIKTYTPRGLITAGHWDIASFDLEKRQGDSSHGYQHIDEGIWKSDTLPNQRTYQKETPQECVSCVS
jgi:hypothetical protein